MKRRHQRARRYVGGFTPIANEHMRILYDDMRAFVVLMLLYQRAAYEPHRVFTKRGHAHLGRGQCVCGQRELAARLHMTVNVVRGKLTKLEQSGAITIDARATGTIVTIPFLAGGSALDVGPVDAASNHALDIMSTTRSSPVPPPQIGDPTNSTKSCRPVGIATTTHSARLTKSAAPDDDGAARNSNSLEREPGKEKVDPRIAELHAYLEKHRRRALGEVYRPIPLSVVSRQIAERLAKHSIADCKAVVRADAAEANARYFGVQTWREQNFDIKLPKQLQSEQTRRERHEPVSWRESKYVQQRRLDGEVSFVDGATERDVLLAKYDEFTWRFHRHKGTWREVKHLRDREDRTWFRRDEVSDG